MRALMLTLALLTACTTNPSLPDMYDRDWTLLWVDGFESLPDGVQTPAVRFESGGRLTANTGCNTAGGSFTLAGDRLRLGELAMTRRACLDPRGNELEAAFSRALQAVRRVRVAGQRLEFLDENERVVARFRQQ